MNASLDSQPTENLDQNRIDLKAAARLATSLIKQDGLKAFIFYLVLLVPAGLGSANNDPFPSIALQTFDRVLHLIFLYWITARWLGRLRRTDSLPNWGALLRCVLIGCVLWAIVQIPLLAFAYSASPASLLFALVAIIPATLVSLRYYFYFLPVGLGVKEPRAIFKLAKSITDRDPLLAIKTLVTPMALMSLLLAILFAISPQGELPLMTWFVSAASSFFWIMSSYFALAAALYALPEKDWRNFDLEPYRNARLATMELSEITPVSKMLLPRQGIKLMAIALILSTANLLRLWSTTPPAEFKVQTITIKESQVTIDLHVSPTQGDLETFEPYYLRLAGEKGSIISLRPESVTMNGANVLPGLFRVPSGHAAVRLQVVFNTDRGTEGLRDLEDLKLWYRNAALVPLDMKKAEVAKPEISEASPAPSSQPPATHELMS